MLNSKVRYYIARRNNEYEKIAAQDITTNDIRGAIMAHNNNNKANGTDFAPAEIPQIGIIFNAVIENVQKLAEDGAPRVWEKETIALNRKSGDLNSLDSYRPITLLQAIYKIWATFITNRIPYNKLTHRGQPMRI